LAVQLFNELKRFLFCRQIQRDDDSIFCHSERSEESRDVTFGWNGGMSRLRST
jgi:hypothetical protein